LLDAGNYRPYRLGAVLLALLVVLANFGSWASLGPTSVAGTASWQGWTADLFAVIAAVAVYRGPTSTAHVAAGVASALVSFFLIGAGLWMVKAGHAMAVDALGTGLLFALIGSFLLVLLTARLALDNATRREVGITDR
jgi:hypothetical protein